MINNLTSEDNAEIRRVVRNFNKRLKRLESYGMQFLPEKQSVKELKQTFANRRDLQRRLNQLKQFDKKSASKIIKVGKDRVKMTEWEYKVFQRDRRVAKRRIEKEIGEIQSAITSRSRSKAPVQTLKREYLAQRLDELELLTRSTRGLSRSQIRSTTATAEKEVNRFKRDQTFKNNFFDMMFRDAQFTGLRDSRVDEIKAKLSELSPQQLLMAYYAEPQLKHFVEYYGGKDFARAKEAEVSEINKMDKNIDNLLSRVDSIVKEFKDK